MGLKVNIQRFFYISVGEVLPARYAVIDVYKGLSAFGNCPVFSVAVVDILAFNGSSLFI